MSSPISSLKKNKRSPLHSPSKPSPERLAPFRHPDFSDDQLQHLTERTHSVRFIKGLKPFRRSDPSVTFLESLSSISRAGEKHAIHDHNLYSPSEHELMSLLMSRLVQVENKLIEAQRLVYEKDKMVKSLDDKVKIYEKIQEENSPSKFNELELRCVSLQQQVQDMEWFHPPSSTVKETLEVHCREKKSSRSRLKKKFLADYGMVWVGEKRSNSLSASSETTDMVEERVVAESTWKPESAITETTGSVSTTSDKEALVEYDLIIEHIAMLNMLAGDGTSHVDTTSGATAQFRSTEPIPLTLYANGILLFNGPFRFFTESSTRQFVQDLMDGFYPSELQLLYPEGVPFKVVDRRDVVYRPTQIPFHGEGFSVSGETKSPNLFSVLDEYRLVGYSGRSAFTSPPDSVDKRKRFLEKLPRIVVREGNIICIRDPVADLLQNTQIQPETKLVRTPVDDDEKENKKRDVNTVALRIKSENGLELYLLKMYTNNRIGDVRQCLDRFRPSHSRDYRIISLCPYQEFSNEAATLQDCGLIHNAALFLRPLSQMTVINIEPVDVKPV